MHLAFMPGGAAAPQRRPPGGGGMRGKMAIRGKMKREIPSLEKMRKEEELQNLTADPTCKKIFVGGVPHTATEEDIRLHFTRFGEVTRIEYKTDAMTGKPRGFAFVEFSSPSALADVMAFIGRHAINGRLVDVKRAVPSQHHQKRQEEQNTSVEAMKPKFEEKAKFIASKVSGDMDTESTAKLVDALVQMMMRKHMAQFGGGRGRGRGMGMGMMGGRGGMMGGRGGMMGGRGGMMGGRGGFVGGRGRGRGMDHNMGMGMYPPNPRMSAEIRKRSEKHLDQYDYDRTVFVGGLTPDTTDEDLEEAFGTYGKITEAVVKRDPTGRSRCFGFIRFKAREARTECLDNQAKEKHVVKERSIDVKPASKEAAHEGRVQQQVVAAQAVQGAAPAQPEHACKIFAGALPPETMDRDLYEYFREFGAIRKVEMKYDPNTHKHRGFAFIEFEDPSGKAKCLEPPNRHEVCGKVLDVKGATIENQNLTQMMGHAAAAFEAETLAAAELAAVSGMDLDELIEAVEKSDARLLSAAVHSEEGAVPAEEPAEDEEAKCGFGRNVF